jgi:hypothetical protein
MITSLLPGVLSVLAQSQAPAQEPVITVAGQAFLSWEEYTSSALFRQLGLRCGTSPTLALDPLPPSDCSMSNTTIRPDYDPTTTSPLYRIPVVFHVLRSSTGTGDVSDARLQTQIDVLNEDFRALAGSLGEDGNDARVEFFLATEDPQGNPTTGITRHNNTTWYNDGGGYYNTLNWDATRYLNLYTNQASGALGYVRGFPAQGGFVGSSTDHVVLLWSAVGRNAPIGPPYNLGRTATHEVGHWLGLFHTFQNNGTCPSAASCASNGDLICDTNPELNPVFGCPLSHNSCASSDPFHNYMDYSDDDCYTEFTPDQVNRVRCTLVNWRTGLDAGCTTLASATIRNGGSNPLVYTATPPVLGGSTTLTVTDPTHTTAFIVGYAAPGSLPIASGVLLVDTSSARLFQVSFPLATGSLVMPIPSDVALCGETAFTQAVLLGGTGLALANAVDMTAGI